MLILSPQELRGIVAQAAAARPSRVRQVDDAVDMLTKLRERCEQIEDPRVRIATEKTLGYLLAELEREITLRSSPPAPEER